MQNYELFSDIVIHARQNNNQHLPVSIFVQKKSERLVISLSG